MTPNLQEWVRINRPVNCGRVLEIGSLNVNGGVRQFFPDATEYIGIDVVMGAGVDMVLSGHSVTRMFGYKSFDTIICLETIEHDPQFWELINSVRLALRDEGHFILSSPTIGFPYHHPPDYYRFTMAAIHSLMHLADCCVLKSDSLPDTIGNHSIIAIGIKG